MKRILVIALLSSTIGLPTAVGVTETCAHKFDQEWAKRVLSITTWNAKHPDVVKRRHLDRDMSKITAAARKKLMKELEVMCDVGLDRVNPVAYGLDSLPTDSGLDNGQVVEVGLEEVQGTPQMIAEREYPVYASNAKDLPNDGQNASYSGFPGWFGGGGYLGAHGGGSGVPNNPPPVTPIAPTPEPSTLVLGLTGIALGIWRKVSK